MMRVYRGTAAVCRACPHFRVCTTDARQGRALEVGPHEAALRAHRAWMATEEAQTLARQRKALVEPVFGMLKEELGARRFLLRGRANVAAEWTLVATTTNLRTCVRLWQHDRLCPPGNLPRCLRSGTAFPTGNWSVCNRADTSVRPDTALRRAQIGTHPSGTRSA